jgi:hypothetical protein
MQKIGAAVLQYIQQNLAVSLWIGVFKDRQTLRGGFLSRRIRDDRQREAEKYGKTGFANAIHLIRRHKASSEQPRRHEISTISSRTKIREDYVCRRFWLDARKADLRSAFR